MKIYNLDDDRTIEFRNNICIDDDLLKHFAEQIILFCLEHDEESNEPAA